ncbi:MAG: hypothetical protein C0625_06490 [Arcobacter sp.]|nr:MAG: hypothetical protein C0625_06490 [Arcobacter sp.]
MVSLQASELPNFLDKKDIINAEFKCLGTTKKYNKEEQKHIDVLWDETLSYLNAYAQALTNSSQSQCLNSDEAMIDSTNGVKKMCIMDRRDMKILVNNIYQVVNNPDKAKECFSAREDVSWIYSPGEEIEKNSPVAQWLNRTTFEEFFDKKVTNKDVKKLGKVQFDAGHKDEHKMWNDSSYKKDSLMYFHQNTIHAFEVEGDCEAKPEERAIVSVWARSNAHDKRNDYGTTLLCESAEKPGTPAHRGEMIQCDLTHTKW